MNDTSDSARDSAIDWLARLHADDASDADRRNFVSWFHASPANQLAFTEARVLWERLAVVSALPATAAAAPRRTGARGHRWQITALAATICVALLMTIVWDVPLDLSSPTGVVQRFELDDGSALELNTASAARVRYDDQKRRVELLAGEAFFEVRRDTQRPFEVTTPAGIVTAVGTAFSVRLDGPATRVQVTEGTVRITTRDARTSNRVSAHQQIAFGADVLGEPVQSDSNDLSWREGQLVYENVRLSDLVADLNRYMPTRMAVEDEALANRRISAVLRFDDQETALRALSQVLPIRWSRVSADLIVLTPSG